MGCSQSHAAANGDDGPPRGRPHHRQHRKEKQHGLVDASTQADETPRNHGGGAHSADNNGTSPRTRQSSPRGLRYATPSAHGRSFRAAEAGFDDADDDDGGGQAGQTRRRRRSSSAAVEPTDGAVYSCSGSDLGVGGDARAVAVTPLKENSAALVQLNAMHLERQDREDREALAEVRRLQSLHKIPSAPAHVGGAAGAAASSGPELFGSPAHNASASTITTTYAKQPSVKAQKAAIRLGRRVRLWADHFLDWFASPVPLPSPCTPPTAFGEHDNSSETLPDLREARVDVDEIDDLPLGAVAGFDREEGGDIDTGADLMMIPMESSWLVTSPDRLAESSRSAMSPKQSFKHPALQRIQSTGGSFHSASSRPDTGRRTGAASPSNNQHHHHPNAVLQGDEGEGEEEDLEAKPRPTTPRPTMAQTTTLLRVDSLARRRAASFNTTASSHDGPNSLTPPPEAGGGGADGGTLSSSLGLFLCDDVAGPGITVVAAHAHVGDNTTLASSTGSTPRSMTGAAHGIGTPNGLLGVTSSSSAPHGSVQSGALLNPNISSCLSRRTSRNSMGTVADVPQSDDILDYFASGPPPEELPPARPRSRGPFMPLVATHGYGVTSTGGAPRSPSAALGSGFASAFHRHSHPQPTDSPTAPVMPQQSPGVGPPASSLAASLGLPALVASRRPTRSSTQSGSCTGTPPTDLISPNEPRIAPIDSGSFGALPPGPEEHPSRRGTVVIPPTDSTARNAAPEDPEAVRASDPIKNKSEGRTDAYPPLPGQVWSLRDDEKETQAEARH
jgi:hypothetical protein